jgi:hypothetical protein
MDLRSILYPVKMMMVAKINATTLSIQAQPVNFSKINPAMMPKVV